MDLYGVADVIEVLLDISMGGTSSGDQTKNYKQDMEKKYKENITMLRNVLTSFG